MGIYEKPTISVTDRKILLLHRDHFKVLHAVNNKVIEQVLCVSKIKNKNDMCNLTSRRYERFT